LIGNAECSRKLSQDFLEIAWTCFQVDSSFGTRAGLLMASLFERQLVFERSNEAPPGKSIRTANVEERVPGFALNLNALVDCGLGSICRARFPGLGGALKI
jgi:hypothetical protein